jgi:hypothetical protein
MTQAARNDTVVRAGLLAAPRADLALATGDETPGRSPALELQIALEDLFNPTSAMQPDYRRLALFGTVLLIAGGLCLAFWWAALSWAVSVLG